MEASAITDRMNSYCQSEVAGFWAVWNANRSAENAIPLLTALLGARAHDERIPVIFDKTEPSEVPEEILNMAALEGEYHAVARRDLAGALDYLTNFAKQYPQFDSIMRGHQAHLIMILDRLPSPELLKLPKNLAPLDAEMLVVARAEAQVAQGLVFDAAATLATVNPERRRAAILKQVLDIHVLMLEQDIAMGVEVAVRRLWEAVVAGDIRTLSAWAYVAGLGMCLLGRFDELKSIVEIIYRLGDASVYQNHYRVGLYMLGSYVSSWEGLTSYSNNLVQQAKALAVGTGPMPGMRANLSLLPGTENAPDMAWEEVDDLLDRGFLVSAVFHAITAAETDPTSPTAKRLLELCAKFQGPVLPAMARYVATLVARDSTLYEATVSELRKSCGALVTTRAIISWALLLREKGDLEGWVEKAQAAWQESTAMSDPASGLFRRLTEAVDLTIREAEVAHYAVLGLSAQEIASKTGISTRTVETHLHFVYRKTGVSSRADLRQLTQTWLVLPTED
jgi:DNA-binding CsgD family transcriptional regulator